MGWKPSKTLVASLRKKYGVDSIVSLSTGGYSRVDSVLPTGCVVLDRWVLGKGGLPYGHGTEIWGRESSGKTTLLQQIGGVCQRVDDGAVFLRDAENKIQEEWARKFGLNIEDVLLQLDGTVEMFVDAAMLFIAGVPASVPKLVALDSLAFLASKDELKGGGDGGIGANARAWSEKMKVFPEALAKHKAAFVFLNQPRKQITNFGAWDTSPGGNAMKAFPLVRLKMTPKDKFIDSRGEGQIIQVKAVKNQIDVPFRECKLKLRFDGSFDDKWSIVDHAKDVGCIDKKSTRAYWRDALKNLGWEDSTQIVESFDKIGDDALDAAEQTAPVPRIETPDDEDDK